MNPRLSNSKTWTHFPEEFLEQVQDLVTETFEEYLIDGASLHLEGRIYPEEILFRLGIKMEGQIRQHNFEVSAPLNPQSQNAKKLMHHCIEAAASMMAEYFEWHNLPQNEEHESGEIDFPREWTQFNFEGVPLFLQYSTINTNLEAQADQILGASSSDSGLVQSMESEDALDFTMEEKIKVPENEFDAEFDEDDLNYEADRTH